MKCIAKAFLLIAELGIVVGCSAKPPPNSVCESEKTQIELAGNQNERLPLGLAKMPGSKMHGPAILDGSKMGSGVSISSGIEVPGKLEEIGKFYEREFRRINAKIELLEYHDDLIVLSGPTEDGGYLMVGIDMRQWSGVPKGSAKVDIHYQADCL
jgi:hypothetical protein